MVISLHSKYPYSGKRKRGKGEFRHTERADSNKNSPYACNSQFLLLTLRVYHREDTPSRQKKNKFLCFALDFLYLCT